MKGVIKMIKFKGYIFILFIIISASCNYSCKSSYEDVEYERSKIISTFEKSLSATDSLQQVANASTIADAYVSMHTEDAVLMIPGMPEVIGSKKIHSFVLDFFQDYKFEFPEWKSEEIVVAGDWAFHRFSGIAVIIPKNGDDSIRLDRKYLDIYRKQPNGEWKVARHIFNLNK